MLPLRARWLDATDSIRVQRRVFLQVETGLRFAHPHNYLVGIIIIDTARKRLPYVVSDYDGYKCRLRQLASDSCYKIASAIFGRQFTHDGCFLLSERYVSALCERVLYTSS